MGRDRGEEEGDKGKGSQLGLGWQQHCWASAGYPEACAWLLVSLLNFAQVVWAVRGTKHVRDLLIDLSSEHPYMAGHTHWGMHNAAVWMLRREGHRVAGGDMGEGGELNVE